MMKKRVEVEKTGIVVDEVVGGRRGGQSSSQIKGRLGAFLGYFALLYRCRLVVWYGTIFVMLTRRDDCGCDSVLSSRPDHTDPSEDKI
jgi:hypothetical protein